MKEQLHEIEVLLAEGEIKKADIYIARLLRSDLPPSERAAVLLHRARARLLSARPEDALDDIAMANNLAPHDNLDALLEITGDSYFARFELASVGFADRQDTLRAQQTYEQIIEKYANYANLGWVYYQLGRIHVTANQITTAVEYFQKALLSPTRVRGLTAYCYERLGFINYYERRDLEKALAFLDRAVETYPSSEKRGWLAQVHMLRSRVLKGMGNYTSALRAAEAALAAASSENRAALSEALLTAAELLSEVEGREKDLIQYIQQFTQSAKKPLGVDVTWSRVNEMLGNAYFNLGQYEQAVTAYQAALQFNPDNPWGLALYYQIAKSYYQQRNYSEAVTVIERLLAIARSEQQTVDDYRVYDVLGNALFALKKYDQAVQAYQAALQIAPPNADSVNKIKSYRDMAQELI